MRTDLQQRASARAELFEQNIALYKYISTICELRCKYQRQMSLQAERVQEELQSMAAERQSLKEQLSELSAVQQVIYTAYEIPVSSPL
jgi:hypothetical protein